MSADALGSASTIDAGAAPRPMNARDPSMAAPSANRTPKWNPPKRGAFPRQHTGLEETIPAVAFWASVVANVMRGICDLRSGEAAIPVVVLDPVNANVQPNAVPAVAEAPGSHSDRRFPTQPGPCTPKATLRLTADPRARHEACGPRGTHQAPCGSGLAPSSSNARKRRTCELLEKPSSALTDGVQSRWLLSISPLNERYTPLRGCASSPGGKPHSGSHGPSQGWITTPPGLSSASICLIADFVRRTPSCTWFGASGDGS